MSIFYVQLNFIKMIVYFNILDIIHLLQIHNQKHKYYKILQNFIFSHLLDLHKFFIMFTLEKCDVYENTKLYFRPRFSNQMLFRLVKRYNRLADSVNYFPFLHQYKLTLL